MKTFRIKIQTKETSFKNGMDGNNWLYKNLLCKDFKDAIKKGSKYGVVCGVQDEDGNKY